MNKSIIFFFVFTCIFQLSFGQNESASQVIYLINSENVNRKVKIDLEKYNRIKIKLYAKDIDTSKMEFIHQSLNLPLDTTEINYNEGGMQLFAKIKNFEKDSLTIFASDKVINYQLTDENFDVKVVEDIKMQSVFTPPNSLKKNVVIPYNRIAIQDINFIELQTEARRKKMKFGKSLLIGSAVTSLVVAPLVGLLSDDTNFNNNAYYTVAGIGAAGALVSIPLVRMKKYKFYKITADKNLNSEFHWYFQSE